MGQTVHRVPRALCQMKKRRIDPDMQLEELVLFHQPCRNHYSRLYDSKTGNQSSSEREDNLVVEGNWNQGRDWNCEANHDSGFHPTPMGGYEMLPIVGRVGESEKGMSRRHWTMSSLSPGYAFPCLMTEMYLLQVSKKQGCNFEGSCVTALTMSAPLLVAHRNSW